MEGLNYSNIANKLLGDELYYKFIKEISEENTGTNLVDFGKEILDKCCGIIVMLGMSKRIKLDSVKLCTGDSIIEVSCKEFADKYERYVSEIEKNLF